MAKKTNKPKKNSGQKIAKKIEELKKLANSLDPYIGPTESEAKVLSKYGITEYKDPFKLTNEVLLLLENALETGELDGLKKNQSPGSTPLEISL